MKMKYTLPHPKVMITSWQVAHEILNDPKTRTGLRGAISINERDRGQPKDLVKVNPNLKLIFDDAEHTTGFFARGYNPPSPEDIRRIIEFAGVVQEGPLLIHCAQGISRSAATALIVLAVWNGPGKEKETWEQFTGYLRENMMKRYRASAEIHPNRRMILLADQMLKRNKNLWRVVCRGMFPMNPNYENFELE